MNDWDEEGILKYLGKNEAVLTNSHFIYTSGLHGTAYINLRAVAQNTTWMDQVSYELYFALNAAYEFDVIIGPETLGRNLAILAAQYRGDDEIKGIWCDIGEVDDVKQASFSPKLNFGALVAGQKVVIVDDLVTSGLSIKLVAALVRAHGGIVVAAGAVVRRSPDVTAEDCDVPALEILAEVSNFEVFTPEACAQNGPCSTRVPVVLRPGHGHEWIKSHEDYPVA